MLSLAFYLPQFHPIPENDRWWGTGFTEWTHMEKAKAWYPGHRVRQPIEPLGRYDLLDAATIEAQYAVACAHGIDGFLIWDYWLGDGRRLLERPVAIMLEQQLKVRYALAWANHSWENKWQRRTLAEQHYLGAADYTRYFQQCLPHFLSDQYIRIGGKPAFFIHRPEAIPDLGVFVRTWRRLAVENGLPGLHLIGDLLTRRSPRPEGLDACSCSFGFWTNWKKLLLNYVKEKARTKLHIAQPSPQRFDFTTLLRNCIPSDAPLDFIPTVLTGWDTTPRHGRNGVIVDGLTPQTFRQHLADVAAHLARQPVADRLVLVKSWNEWAEGNLLEPDSIHGDALLREYLRFSKACQQLPSTPPTRPRAG